MNYHQTPEEIIKNATAEQRLLWNSVFLRFGEKIGIQQFYYIGAIASEVNIYSANKMYLFYQLTIFSSLANNALIGPAIVFGYDESNVLTLQLHNSSMAWDTAGAAFKYTVLSAEYHNILVSRLSVNSGYDRVICVGFRLSI